MPRRICISLLFAVLIAVSGLICCAIDLPYRSAHTLTEEDSEKAGWLKAEAEIFGITGPIPDYTGDFEVNFHLETVFGDCDFNPPEADEARFETMGRKDGIAILWTNGIFCTVGEFALSECRDCGKHLARLVDSDGEWDKDAHLHKALRRSLEDGGPCLCVICKEQITPGKIVFTPDEDGFGTIVWGHGRNLTPVIVNEIYGDVFLYVKTIMREAAAVKTSDR